MAIILEGPDNSGKSTVATAIAEHFSLPHIVAGGPCKSEAEALERFTTDYFDMQRPVVMDRSVIISETIYGPICRNKIACDPRLWFRKMAHLSQVQQNFMLIFCDAPDEVLLDMSTHIIKPYETEEHIKAVFKNKVQLIQAYRQMAHYCGLFMDVTVINPRDKKQSQELIEALYGVIN